MMALCRVYFAYSGAFIQAGQYTGDIYMQFGIHFHSVCLQNVLLGSKTRDCAATLFDIDVHHLEKIRQAKVLAKLGKSDIHIYIYIYIPVLEYIITMLRYQL